MGSSDINPGSKFNSAVSKKWRNEMDSQIEEVALELQKTVDWFDTIVFPAIEKNDWPITTDENYYFSMIPGAFKNNLFLEKGSKINHENMKLDVGGVESAQRLSLGEIYYELEKAVLDGDLDVKMTSDPGEAFADTSQETKSEGKVKITKRQLRRIIKEELIREADPDTDADDAEELRDIADKLETEKLPTVVNSWIKFVDRNYHIKDILLDAWEKMTDGSYDPHEISNRVGETIGLASKEKGQMFLPVRGSKEEKLGSIRSGVMWHARKVKPDQKYLSRDEIDQEIEQRRSDRATAREAMKATPLRKKPSRGGSRYRPWDQST